MDRQSELPNSLILAILSSLEMREVVSTSLLSTRWQNLWTAVSCLDFRYDSRSFVYNALTHWRGPKLLKFNISCSSHHLPRAYDLDSWLLFAIEKQVEDLSVHLDSTLHRHRLYSPTQRFYSRSSIRKLSLSCIRLRIEGNVQWDQLQSLAISGSNSLTANAIQKILAGAPRLEELSLCIREIGENFIIESTSLKSLCIGKEDECFEIVEVYLGSVLRISAPNLLNLVISSRCYGSCVLNVPSLTRIALNLFDCGDESGHVSRVQMFSRVFQSVRRVQNLTLSNWCIKINGKSVEFPNAKVLHLYPDEPADEMLDVLDMFPVLEIFISRLQCAQKGWSFASTTTASLHRLKAAEIRWCGDDAAIFRVIETVLGNADLLEKMVIRLWGIGRTFVSAQEKVLKMPRSSPTAELIIIQDSSF